MDWIIEVIKSLIALGVTYMIIDYIREWCSSKIKEEKLKKSITEMNDSFNNDIAKYSQIVESQTAAMADYKTELQKISVSVEEFKNSVIEEENKLIEMVNNIIRISDCIFDSADLMTAILSEKKPSNEILNKLKLQLESDIQLKNKYDLIAEKYREEVQKRCYQQKLNSLKSDFDRGISR